jgi:uncharacterized phage protein gp47/JayE
MAIDSIPIPTPLIDPRDGVELAAEAIARMNAACPELTNNDPASPFAVMAESQAFHVEQVLYAINRLPDAVQVAFASLFGIELRLALPATTTLTFTVTAPAGTYVTIPAGTRVATADGSFVFATDTDLELAPGVTSGEVSATAVATGHTVLQANTLTRVIDPVAWVQAVTNAGVVDSGAEQETVTSALERSRNYQQRAERIVSANDLASAIRDEVMAGNCILQVFEKTEDGYWDPDTQLGRRLGNTTVLLMTAAGNAVSTEVRQQIGALCEQLVGHLQVFIKDPVYHEFSVAADVRLVNLARQADALARIQDSLETFYAVKAANIGRGIHVSEIVEFIEGTPLVDFIVPQPGGSILSSPAADIELLPYELPKLISVTINFV